LDVIWEANLLETQTTVKQNKLTIDMLFAIDIGNTNIDLALFEEKQLISNRTIPSRETNQTDHATSVNNFVHNNTTEKKIDAALISSVVQGLGNKFVQYCSSNDIAAQQVDNTWDLGITINYDPPEHAGIDRLLSAAAAFDIAPHQHSVVIADAGTAITVDIVDSSANYLGGTITPGFHLMNQALHSCTSLLPHVDLKKTGVLPASNTPEGIRSGLLYGAASIVDGIGQRLAQSVSTPSWLVITGGDGPMLFPHIQKYHKCVPHLVLHGLAKAWELRH
jgi:type III pantothenate kinase